MPLKLACVVGLLIGCLGCVLAATIWCIRPKSAVDIEVTSISQEGLRYLLAAKQRDLMITASLSGDLIFWRESTQEKVKTLKVTAPIVDIRLAKDGSRLAVGMGKITIFDLTTFQSDETEIVGRWFDFLPNAQNDIVVLDKFGRLKVWDSRNHKCVKDLGKLDGSDQFSALSSGRSRNVIAIGRDDGSLAIVDGETGMVVFEEKGFGDQVQGLLFATNDSYLLVGYRSGTIGVFAATNHRNSEKPKICDSKPHSMFYGFDTDSSGSRLLVLGRNPSVTALEIPSLSRRWTAPRNTVGFANCVAVSHDTVYAGFPTGEVWKITAR